MSIEKPNPQGEAALNEALINQTDPGLKKTLSTLTRGYIGKIASLYPDNREAIDNARSDFEGRYIFEITLSVKPIQVWHIEKPPEEIAMDIRQAAAVIVEELFSNIYPPTVVEVQKRTNGFMKWFQKKPPKQLKLENWQRGNLMFAACGAVTYAANESKSHTERQVNPEILDVLRKGILGADEQSVLNFRENLNLFVQNQPPVEVKDERNKPV